MAEDQKSNILKKTFHSNGKLLLTSEFLVIDGAKALALPTRFGQKMTVERLSESEIHWNSYSCDNKLWYEEIFDLTPKQIIPLKNKNSNTTQRLLQIFSILQNLNPTLFQNGGFSIKTNLEFPQNWGLGSSSTLITNLAKWAGVNPYELSNKTFGGSAYDIACAQTDSAIVYQRTNPTKPKVIEVNFNPSFKDQLFFVHRNQKQNTRTVVTHYKNLNPATKQEWIAQANDLTNQFLNCEDLNNFENLINAHENLLAKILKIPPVKQSHFPDYPHAIKSLGAWGGDFIMAVGEKKDQAYFKNKGFETILSFEEMFF